MKHIINSFIIAGCALVPTFATEIPWKGDAFQFASNKTKLRDVLKKFGASYGVDVIVNDSIVENFSGNIVENNPNALLQSMKRRYNLSYYYDGHTLFFYKNKDLDVSFIPVDRLDKAKLMEQLQAANILDAGACQIIRNETPNTIQIYGVPVCILRANNFIKQLKDQQSAQENSDQSMKMIKLKYASASDMSYEFRGQKVSVPGVVSILNNLTTGRAAPVGDKATYSGSVASFSADENQNAVIIKDIKKNFSSYEALISQLDVPQKMIEVSVAIIDVDVEDMNNLGVDWSLSKTVGQNSISFNAGAGTMPTSFSSVINNAGQFMIKINALAQQSKAKIVSRPSVVTLDNVQAILDKNITFYTKVSNQNVANLQSVTAGSLMRVTPHLVEDNERQKMLLTINIQDGRQGDAAVDSLPQVLNAEITTKASLDIGQSLLLGGFIQSEESSQLRKIPILGDIPIVGAAFRARTLTKRNTVRLFLIKTDPYQI